MISMRVGSFGIGACLGVSLGPHGCATCPVELGAAPEGMPVVIFYEDEADEFEYDATLGHSADPHWMGMWMARFDETTFRRIR